MTVLHELGVVLVGVIALAIVAVIVGKSSQAPSMIKSVGNALASLISTAANA